MEYIIAYFIKLGGVKDIGLIDKMKIKNGSELQSPNDELIETFEEY
ncbi:hypothetical protein P9X15_29195 [Bacillus cereus]|nr:hypothetical protein [Bacillus cereus]